MGGVMKITHARTISEDEWVFVIRGFYHFSSALDAPLAVETR